MKNHILITSIIAVGMLISFSSCNKDENDGNETKISSNYDNKSHNIGENCMNCHVNGGSGAGWFNLAGTIYDSTKTRTYPNIAIQLYTGRNGTGELVKTIEVDAKGNFFTTENIDYGQGLYVSAQGDLIAKYMFSPITNGACNSCHGVTTDRVWTK